MKALFSKPWFLTLLGFALIGGLVFVYTTCTGPSGALTRKQERTIASDIATDQRQVGTDTTASKRATVSAAADERAGQAHEAAAILHHKASKPHAPTPITSATLRAADSLLANY